MTADLQGIALVLGGAAGLITAVGTVTLQVITLIRQASQEHSARLRSAKLDAIAVHVNGLNENVASGAYAKGKAAGIDQERENPMIAAPQDDPATNGLFVERICHK